ncbi:hypothetical protein PGT21_032563 [Puccinia graminis f. sp. tritici]|uniref:Uncharacterized protein n=1 Tax=Puccinia graminis f. sp. tritici TaxID=56615 RepID=A0A5B0NDV2_PUCGR|nr:hypothetical protein PGT21_032563 [Puccinia graminis f. sp. tritici]
MQVQAAPPTGKRQQTHHAVHFDLNPEPIMPAKQPTSKKRTKAEKKRLRKAQQAVFCWYCEREFEDAKGVESSSFSQP